MTTIQELKEYLDSRFATKDDFTIFATKEDFAMFATKEDLKKFATKDDLRGFATKEDLSNFATRDDLGGFATKDDLGKFATKDDLVQTLDRRFDEFALMIADGFAQTVSKDELGEVKRDLQDVKRRLGRIEGALAIEVAVK